MISLARNSNQCDTLKTKYATFPKPDQKSLEVCGKNSSGFTKAESGSIIHESCFHHIEKKRPQFSVLHWLNFDLHFICPWSFNALILAKICQYKTSTVTSLLSLPGGTDINLLISPEMYMILKFVSCSKISLYRLCLWRCCYRAGDS